MNCVLYVNKPKGITSFDVCYKLRKVFNTKKIGHTGTLDPNATGVMIVLIGNTTKLNQFLVSDCKEYVAKVKLGIETDTLDIDGKVIKEENCIMPNESEINNVLHSFLGEQKQLPPMTSAIKVNGKKLYEYQRENKEVEIPVKDIEIFSIDLLSVENDTFTFKTKVSSGTYIRALVRDILNKLNLIGTLYDLERTSINDVDISECDDLISIQNNEFNPHDSLEILSKKYQTFEVKNRDDIINGKRIKCDLSDDLILCTYRGEALAMYQKDNCEYKCLRGLL